MTPEDQRRERAERRRRQATLHRTVVRPVEEDVDPLHGEVAVSLAFRLTRESWLLSGQAIPTYSRDETPYRFVRPIP